MTLRVLRAVVVVICIGGIVGLIIGSNAGNNNGVVITFGLIPAVSVGVLMAVSAAVRSSSGATGGGLADAVLATEVQANEVLAAQVEQRISGLVTHRIAA